MQDYHVTVCFHLITSCLLYSKAYIYWKFTMLQINCINIPGPTDLPGILTRRGMKASLFADMSQLSTYCRQKSFNYSMQLFLLALELEMWHRREQLEQDNPVVVPNDKGVPM